MEDFSAAHSHDTHWFAIDRDGRIGIFFTSENGHMPVLAGEADSGELVEMARAVLGEDLPGVEDDDVEDWDEFRTRWSSSAGTRSTTSTRSATPRGWWWRTRGTACPTSRC